MTQVFRRFILSTFLLPATVLISTTQLHAQDAPSFLDRQLARTDLGVSAVGEFTTTTNGLNYLQQNVTTRPSTTVGYLINLRYSKSTFIGAELNYHVVRYTDNYTVVNTSATPATVNNPGPFAVQTSGAETTIGYLVRSPKEYFGVTPFASIGLGAIDYRPTPGGGQGQVKQAVAAYYYSVGVDSPIYYNHLGLRLGFRQVLYSHPDYFDNFLTDNKRAIASQPTVGFFIRF